MPTVHRRLAALRVASPCHERWEDMEGDEQKRFCGRCDKHVYNVSAMPAEQAEELLTRSNMGICVRFSRRSDGTVVTGDCPVGRQRRSLKLSLAVASMFAAAACETTQGAPVPVMGAMVAALPDAGVSAPDAAQPLLPATDDQVVGIAVMGEALPVESPDAAVTPKNKLSKRKVRTTELPE